MKKLYIFILIFLFFQNIILCESNPKVSQLFNEYLKRVLQIVQVPERRNYIVIDVTDCPGCVQLYIETIEKRIKKYKNTSIIFVGADRNGSTIKKFKDNNNVYFDYDGFLRRIALPGVCSYIVVKNFEITKATKITIDNYEKIL